VPIPEDIVRCRLVFDLTQGAQVADQAVMGFHMKRSHTPGNTTNWDADVQEIAEKIVDKWATNMTNSGQWSRCVRLALGEVYHLDANTGRTAHKGMASGPLRGNWTGTSDAASLPFSVACAVSLYGYDPAGFAADAKTKRGRFYLPPFQINAMGDGTSSGLFTVGHMTSLQTAVQAFLNDVHNLEVGGGVAGSGNDNMRLGILSRTRGTFTEVTHIRIGRAPDSQRRRDNALDETYTTAALSPS
jgi:hypothetical protein